jgi:hypothetical protein
VRFFAAVGAVAGLLFLLTTIFTASSAIDSAIGDDAPAASPTPRTIDLVDVVTGSGNPAFQISPDGVAAADTTFVIDPTRQVRVVAGTPGVDHCGRSAEAGACAIVADLLGEGVVWFALVPMGSGRSVALPAIDTLEDGLATLANGWRLPYAPVLDRRCPAPGSEEDEVFESYRQFKQLFGEDFVSVYDLDQRRLTAVVCRQRVAYAPSPGSTLPPLPTTSSSSTVATAVPTLTPTPAP